MERALEIKVGVFSSRRLPLIRVLPSGSGPFTSGKIPMLWAERCLTESAIDYLHTAWVFESPVFGFKEHLDLLNTDWRFWRILILENDRLKDQSSGLDEMIQRCFFHSGDPGNGALGDAET